MTPNPKPALTIKPGDVRRVSMPTALDDHNVLLDPGTYPVEFLTVDFRPTTPEAAYWVVASIPATRTHDGARFGKAGDRVTYGYQVHAYHFTAPGDAWIDARNEQGA